MCYTTKCGKSCHTGIIQYDYQNNTSATTQGHLGTCLECGAYGSVYQGDCDD